MRNKMIDLHNALFVELEKLQDDDLFMNEDGSFDKDKIELAIKRADKVSDVAGKIIELQKVQLDAYKLASDNGVYVKLPELLGIKEEGVND